MGIYATGLVINSRIKPLNMKSFRIFNIIMPIILFAIVFVVMNFAV